MNRQKKKAIERREREPRPLATSPVLRMSPTKVRRVTDLIRGQKVPAAMAALDFLPHRAAPVVRSVLRAALANAEENCGLDADDLFIADVQVNEGFTIPRIRPRAQGRAYRIRKRTCRLTITLAEREE